jgi:hypothetical protein
MAPGSEAIAVSRAMLTPESLRSVNVNFDIAKEALVQVEKRLGDALEAKKAVEQKATVLFGTYVTISLALFGFGGTLAKDINIAAKVWPVFIAGMFFVIGAGAFASVFRSAEYGNLGSEPSMWLQPGRIDGDKGELARMIAYLTSYHAKRIQVSYDSNAGKSRSLSFGMIMGVVGALVLLAAMLFIYGFSASRP